MSPKRPKGKTMTHRFPRVSGDEPLHAFIVQDDSLFSPRERG